MQNFSVAAGPDQYIVTNDSTTGDLVARGVAPARVAVTGNPCEEWLIEPNPAAVETGWEKDISGYDLNLPHIPIAVPDFGVPAGDTKPVHVKSSKVVAENCLVATALA